jgi:divalent metal cation (Fe/Co/Zn/Cd) transporter
LISVNHAEATRDLAGAHHPETSCLGIGLTTVALLEMPLLGQAKQKLGARLNSLATAGEGRQNYLCAAQAAAVLTGLVITTAWPDGWWTDPAIALGTAAWAIYEGNTAWRGDPCGC